MQSEELRKLVRGGEPLRPPETKRDAGDDLIWVVSQVLAGLVAVGVVFLLFGQAVAGTRSSVAAKGAGLVAFCAALYWLMGWHGRAGADEKDQRSGY